MHFHTHISCSVSSPCICELSGPNVKRFDWFVSLENGQISHISLFAHLCSNYRFIKVWCSFHDMPPETIFIRIHLSNWFEWKILSILFSTPDRIAIRTLSIFSLDPIRIYFSPDLVHIGLSYFPCRDSTEIVYVITEGISHSLFELEICFLLHFVCRVRTNSMLRILFCSCSCVCVYRESCGTCNAIDRISRERSQNSSIALDVSKQLMMIQIKFFDSQLKRCIDSGLGWAIKLEFHLQI